MTTKYNRLIEDRFGNELPMTKIGDHAGEPMVGVWDTSYDEQHDDECEECGMMVVNGSCGCEEGADDIMCPDCGMMTIDDECGCGDECSVCGQLPVKDTCGCEGGSSGEWYSMKTPEESLEYMKESDKMCAECGMNENVCECGMNEGKKRNKKKQHYPNLTMKQAKKRLAGVEKKKKAGQPLNKIFGWAKSPDKAYGALRAKAKK